MEDLKLENIQPHELRIGNIISIPCCAAIGRIRSITATSFSIVLDDTYLGFDINEEDNEFDFSEAFGLPLNETRILSLGFKKFANDYAKGSLVLHSRARGYVFNRRVPIMRSVHQLQNFFYASRGQDLEYKEPLFIKKPTLADAMIEDFVRRGNAN